MNDINSVTKLLFTEFAMQGKYVAVHADGNVLLVKVGDADTRIMNWETMNPSEILSIAKGLVLKENYKRSIVLHG